MKLRKPLVSFGRETPFTAFKINVVSMKKYLCVQEKVLQFLMTKNTKQKSGEGGCIYKNNQDFL